MRISEVMDIPVADLKKKDSLMSSYRTYRKKVRDSQLCGAGTSEIYKPIWFAYEVMDSFLGEGLTCKKTQNTEEQLATQNKDGAEQEDQSENVDIPRKVSETVRRRKHPPELLAAGNVVTNALETLKTTINKNSHSQHEDDCDLYGRILAKKLRKLSEDDRLQFMYEIDGMFIRRRGSPIRILASCPAPSTTYVSSPSPSPHSSYSYNCNEFNRSQTSTSSYSDSYVIQERASTSHSTYSEPPIHYSVPVIHIPDNDNNEKKTGGQIILTSNEVVHSATKQAVNTPDTPQYYSLPVINGPNNEKRTGGHILITSNAMLHPATKQAVDTPVHSTIITEAFNMA